MRMEPWRPNDIETSPPWSAHEIVRRIRIWLRWIGWARAATGVLAAVIVVGLGWLLLRTPAPPIEDGLEYATTSIPSSMAPTVVTVHVAGRVMNPGVYALPSNSRVIDAIDIAGGAAFGADTNVINLAATLSDGQRVYVPAVGESIAVDPTSATAGPQLPIDLNTATAADLDVLPGIGPATAAAIIRVREERGRFASVDDLLDVPGIGAAKLDALRGLVRV